MLYNRKNPQWKYSEEQFIGEDEYNQMIDDYTALRKEILTTDIRDINSKLYGPGEPDDLTDEDRETKRKKTLVGYIVIIAAFIAMVVAFLLKQLVIGGLIFCAFFAFAGISLILTGQAEKTDTASLALKNRIMGVFITIGAVAIGLVIIFRDHFRGGELFITICALAFGLAGVALILIMVFRVLSSKIVYTQEVSATCTGYVRYAGSDKAGDSGMVSYFVYTSPVFRYSYSGTQYECVYDEFPVRRDSDIALGQTAAIRIDPRHPENILGPDSNHPAGVALAMVMGIAFTVVGVGLALFLSSGIAAQQTVETSWNPLVEKINGETSETTLPQITDEMIESLYLDKLYPGEDWYVDETYIAEHEITDEGTVVSYADSAFKPTLFTPGDTPPEVGTRVYMFYVIDKDALDRGYGYKQSFVYERVDRMEYVGEHGSFIDN